MSGRAKRFEAEADGRRGTRVHSVRCPTASKDDVHGERAGYGTGTALRRRSSPPDYNH